MTVTPGPVGVPLCGTVITFNSAFLAEIVDLQGVGASRKAIDGRTGNSTSNWATIILSCIKALKPFRVTIAFSPGQDWKTAIAAVLATLTITWPVESGYTTASTLAFSAGITDYTIGGSLEERIMAVVELSPSGVPTITAATS